MSGQGIDLDFTQAMPAYPPGSTSAPAPAEPTEPVPAPASASGPFGIRAAPPPLMPPAAAPGPQVPLPTTAPLAMPPANSLARPLDETPAAMLVKNALLRPPPVETDHFDLPLFDEAPPDRDARFEGPATVPSPVHGSTTGVVKPLSAAAAQQVLARAQPPQPPPPQVRAPAPPAAAEVRTPAAAPARAAAATGPATQSSDARLAFVECLNVNPADPGLHRMAYWVWDVRPDGNPNPRVLLCVHGLSRQGRDFDVLARSLCKDYRVVAPDIVGRGKSDWLRDPMGYGFPQYVSDMVTLIARLNAAELNWMGTSMGGLIGIATLGLDVGQMLGVRKFIINDVGPEINAEALRRIGDYLGHAPTFFDLQSAADYMWSISKGFGQHTPNEWAALSVPMVKAIRQDDKVMYKMHYDPQIAVPFRQTTAEAAAAGEALLWRCYDNIKADTLLVRGEESDVLSIETAAVMAQRGPKAKLANIAGVGHAPTFVRSGQIKIVRDFLAS
jgi:pimeloyl-ACP methyl ester carboxylesterase